MAVVGPVFVDTSVLLAGLIELLPEGEGAQSVLAAIAEKRLRRPLTAWHCCLEFYSVSTRLPPEFRLVPEDALRLLEEEIFARFNVQSLPSADAWQAFFRGVIREPIAGGRIYDAHIAEVARIAGAKVVITENPRHFTSLLSHGIRVVRSNELLKELEAAP